MSPANAVIDGPYQFTGARAQAAGAEVVAHPTDMPYGAREYTVADPEGNLWCFGTYRSAPAGE